MKPSNQTHERRLAALDAARGLAVAGMFIQHFALNQYNSFVSGNTMILFILCSGISYTLSFERARRAGDDGHFPVKMLARAVFIDLTGYILILLNGPFACVLPAYAMLFLLALSLVRCTAYTLVCISGLLCLVSPVLMLVGLSLFWDAALLGDIAGGPLSALAWAPVFTAGMALGKMNLSSPAAAGRMIAAGATLLVPFKLIAVFCLPRWFQACTQWLLQFPAYCDPQTDPYAAWPLNVQPVQWQMLFLDAPQGGSSFELLIGTGGSLILLGLLLLIERRLAPALSPFRAAGQSALTLYVLQFLIAWIFQLLSGRSVTELDIGAHLFGGAAVGAGALFAGWILSHRPAWRIEEWMRKFVGNLTTHSHLC